MKSVPNDEESLEEIVFNHDETERMVIEVN
jgi:hypothetical protein